MIAVGKQRPGPGLAPFRTFGPPELCTWSCGPGVCRFQTTEPQFARKLSKRSDASLVGQSVTNRYLRIFREQIEPWRARCLVTRYLKAANEAFSEHPDSPAAPKRAGKVTMAEKQRRALLESGNTKNTHMPAGG